MDIEWLKDARDVLRYALYVWYSCCGSRSALSLASVVVVKSVSVTLDEVFVVVVP